MKKKILCKKCKKQLKKIAYKENEKSPDWFCEVCFIGN